MFFSRNGRGQKGWNFRSTSVVDVGQGGIASYLSEMKLRLHSIPRLDELFDWL